LAAVIIHAMLILLLDKLRICEDLRYFADAKQDMRL